MRLLLFLHTTHLILNLVQSCIKYDMIKIGFTCVSCSWSNIFYVVYRQALVGSHSCTGYTFNLILFIYYVSAWKICLQIQWIPLIHLFGRVCFIDIKQPRRWATKIYLKLSYSIWTFVYLAFPKVTSHTSCFLMQKKDLFWMERSSFSS